MLNMKKSTPNYMVYGETGFLPLKIDIENRIEAYWSKFCEDTNNISPKLSTIVYKTYLT